MKKTKRNGNIELLRFLFSILIVFHHFDEGVFHGKLFTAGYLGVEFFFIVTGIFLGKKLKAGKETNRAGSFGAAAKEGAHYVWKRIGSIYAYFLLASLIGFAAELFAGIVHVTDVFSFAGDFGFVQLLGLPCLSATGTMWYLCALFFALLLLYPFARQYYDAFVYCFAMLFPPFILGLIVRMNGNLVATTESLFGVFNLGILRAIAMISIGLVVNELSDRVKSWPVNRLNRFVFTACELGFYPVLFAYLIFVTSGKFDYLAVVLMAFLLIVTMSEKSRLYGKLDGKLTAFCGKWSMMLFLCHFFWVKHIRFLAGFLPDIVPKGVVTNVILGFALTFASSVLVYFGGGLLRILFQKAKTVLLASPKKEV